MIQKRKVGGWTAVILLVATGLVIALEALGMPFIRMFVQAWPVFLILLGIEYIWRGRINASESMRFAWGILLSSISISVLALVIFTGWGLVKNLQPSNFSWSKIFEMNLDEIQLFDAERFVKAYSIQPTDEVKVLKIDNMNGNITITTSNQADSEITVRAESRFPLLERQQAVQQAEHSIVTLLEQQGQIELTTQSKRYGFGLIRMTPFIDLFIEVPANHPLSLETKQVNGTLDISGVAIHESIEASTDNGSINIEDVAAKQMELTSTNGAIEVKQASGDTIAHTVNGKITLSGSFDEMDVRTTNGTIRVSSLTVRDDWDVRTTNGSIHLTLPRDSSFSVDGQVTTGKIHAQEPLLPQGKKLQGQIGRGEHDIKASTVNGSLNITLE